VRSTLPLTGINLFQNRDQTMSIQKNHRCSLSDVENGSYQRIVDCKFFWIGMEVTVCTQYPPVHMIRTDTPEKYAEDLVIIIVVGEMLDHKWSPLLTSKHQIEYYFDPSASWATTFHHRSEGYSALFVEKGAILVRDWVTYLHVQTSLRIQDHINRKVRQTCSIFSFWRHILIYQTALCSLAKLLNASKHARSSLSLHNASRVVARNHRPSYRSMI
jgi:hypothetical protein